MKTEEVAALRPGDRVYWWFDTGAGKTGGPVQVSFTVVKVCPRTVRVRNIWDEEFYVQHHKIDGIVDWED